MSCLVKAFAWCILSGAAWVAPAAPMCFSDSVAESDRKNLVGPEGPYPLGVWVCDWPAAYVTSAVVRILLQEILGFNVTETGPGPSTVDAFYALTGCSSPTNVEDRGCSTEPVVTRNHISVEGWTEAYTTTWAQIENDFPSNTPRNLGNMGYFGKTSMYLPTTIKLKAYEAEGLILQFYQGFNVSWTQAEKYFDPPSSIPKERLKRCNETRLMVSQAMDEYANLTQDWLGVEVRSEGGKRIVNGRCWNDYFWYPPACRDDPSNCVIFFTGGTGWNLEETMQKATAWNMPLAPAVAANWGNFSNLPLEFDSTFYWWVPDPTFLLLNPVEITFPAFDRFAHTRGDKRTAPSALSVDKYVSQDLETRAPEAEQLIRALIIDLEVVNDMLRDQLHTGDSSWEVACRWLQQNEALWKSWLPDPTQCVAGFGLFDQQSNSFVMDRTDPSNLICSPCPSGRFSSKLLDGRKGGTYVCKPCPAGQVQASGASLECVPCKAGEFQDVSGSISCKRCRLDEFQDETGATACKACPSGTGSAGLGSAFLSDCGCREGSINTNTSDAAHCVQCSEGLHCPLGSTVEALKSGQAALGPAFVPKIKKGYFSTEEEPTEVFQCQSSQHCPGGVPGTCSGGRINVPCSECPPGASWNGSNCEECAGGLKVLLILVVLIFLLGLTLAYYLLPTRIKLKANPKDGISMSLGVLATLVQCLAIIGLTSVRWPSAFQTVSAGSGVMLLDLDRLSVSCAVSGPESSRYILSITVFPLGVGWLLLCFMCSSRMCRACRAWSGMRAFNTAGHFLQVAFGAMSALALQPLMCQEHPNGQRSLLKQLGVFCGTAEHTAMLLCGVVLLGSLTLGFFGTCAWAARQMPKWSVSAPSKARAFAFLISRFKMDRWWYGVPFLLRGPLLSLCPVLATDFPPAQAALLTLVLTVSVLMHMLFLPWKLPLVNLVDGLIQAMLLLLVAITTSVQVQDDVEVFNEHVALVALFSIALAFTCLAIPAFLAFLFVLVLVGTHEDEDLAILNLGRRRNAGLVSRMSKEVARAIMELENEVMQQALNKLHCVDLWKIVEAMDLIGAEIVPEGTSIQSLNSRVVARRRSSLPELDLGSALEEPRLEEQQDSPHLTYNAAASPVAEDSPQLSYNAVASPVAEADTASNGELGRGGRGVKVQTPQVLGASMGHDQLSLSGSDFVTFTPGSQASVPSGPRVVSMQL